MYDTCPLHVYPTRSLLDFHFTSLSVVSWIPMFELQKFEGLYSDQLALRRAAGRQSIMTNQTNLLYISLNCRCGYLLCLISLGISVLVCEFSECNRALLFMCVQWDPPPLGVVTIYSVWSQWGISFLVGEFLECNPGLRVLTVLFYKRVTGRLFLAMSLCVNKI